MCSFMLICQCCFAIVKVLLKKVTTTDYLFTCVFFNRLLCTSNHILRSVLYCCIHRVSYEYYSAVTESDSPYSIYVTDLYISALIISFYLCLSFRLSVISIRFE